MRLAILAMLGACLAAQDSTAPALADARLAVVFQEADKRDQLWSRSHEEMRTLLGRTTYCDPARQTAIAKARADSDAKLKAWVLYYETWEKLLAEEAVQVRNLRSRAILRTAENEEELLRARRNLAEARRRRATVASTSSSGASAALMQELDGLVEAVSVQVAIIEKTLALSEADRANIAGVAERRRKSLQVVQTGRKSLQSVSSYLTLYYGAVNDAETVYCVR